MSASQWHKFYTASIATTPDVLFDLLADMPNYGRWLPGSAAFGSTTDVDPYPVRLGSHYHDGKPGEQGKDWWDTVTGFQPPGALDFHHVIHVQQLRARERANDGRSQDLRRSRRCPPPGSVAEESSSSAPRRIGPVDWR
jgi:hypothetical protein